MISSDRNPYTTRVPTSMVPCVEVVLTRDGSTKRCYGFTLQHALTRAHRWIRLN